MNKKITDLISEINPEFIEGLDVLDDDEELKEWQALSQTNIKYKALEGIQIGHRENKYESKYKSESESDSKEKSNSKVMQFPKKKLILAFVAILILASGSLVAMSDAPYLRALFGDAFAWVKEQVETVDVQVEHAGVVVTVEEAIITDETGLIMVSCVKKDGTLFEEDAMPYKTQLQVPTSGGMGWSTNSYLEEDGRQLMIVIEVSGSKKIYKQPITAMLDTLGKYVDEVVVVPLGELAQGETTLHVQANGQTQKVRILELAQGQEAVEVTIEYVEGTEDIYYYAPKLVAKNTGKVVEGVEKDKIWDKVTGITTKVITFEGVSLASLENFQLQQPYNYFKKDVDGIWELTFELQKNGRVKRTRPYKWVEKQDAKLLITELEVSALGIKLEGFENFRDVEDLQVSLEMQSGEIKTLTSVSTSGIFNTRVTHHFKLYDQEEGAINGLMLIPIDEIKAVIIEGIRIDV